MSRRLSIEVACVVALLSGCSSMPWYKPMPGDASAGAAAPVESTAPAPAQTRGGEPASASASPAPAAVGPAGPPSAKATADFNRAVNFMRSGNATEAELEFKQMTLAYPRLSTPFV